MSMKYYTTCISYNVQAFEMRTLSKSGDIWHITE